MQNVEVHNYFCGKGISVISFKTVTEGKTTSCHTFKSLVLKISK